MVDFMTKKFILGLVVCLLLLIGTNAWAQDYTYTESGGEVTITRYTGLGGDVIIPDTIDGFQVTSIGDDAFYYADISSVDIPDSIISVGVDSFAY